MTDDRLTTDAAAQHRRAHDWLKPRTNVLLVTHRKPDGDALGSTIGLARFLAAGKIRARIALFDPFPARYQALQPLATFVDWSEVASNLAGYDALVICDTCALGQLPDVADALPTAPPTLIIDHHVTGDPLGERADDLKWIDPSASATCLMIAEMLHSIEPTHLRDREIASALFCGLATDTGWFRYSNADARTHRIVAELLESGMDHAKLFRTLSETDPPQRFALLGRLLSSFEHLCAGQLVVLSIRRQDFDDTNSTPAMTEDLVNAVSSMRGLEVTVMLTELEQNQIRINFRSKSRVDVSEIARSFGGGGHIRASGATAEGAFEAVRDQVVQRLQSALMSAGS